MENVPGQLIDNRPLVLQQKDYGSVELVSAAAVAWIMRSEGELRKYPIWNQYGTSACVAFSFAKQLAIEIYRITGVWVDLSPAFIYQLRGNKGIGSGLGMFTYDAAEIVINKGTTLNALMPSTDVLNLTEDQINAIKGNPVATAIANAIAEAAQSYLYLPKSMDAVAQVIDQKKAVTFTLFADIEEYRTEVPVVKSKLLTYEQAPIRHRVTFTDRNVDEKLGKVLIAEDSWGLGGGKGGRRLITEEFFYSRVKDPVYLDSFSLEPKASKAPHVKITAVVEFIPLNAQGEISNQTKNKTQLENVKQVQDVLKYEGFYPSDKESTGYYGAVTAKGVQKYQEKYMLDTVAALAELAGKRVGPKTLAHMNTKYI